MSRFLAEFNQVLEKAKELEIDIVNFGKMNVIENLKKLERTGKKLRIAKLNCKEIKVRTIYDHIQSIAMSADLLIERKMIKCDFKKLATIIVYHDICEVLITDYPRYTSNYLVNSNPIMNVFEVEKSIREEYAANFIWLFADKEQKEAIELIDADIPEQKELWLLDKIDPIVNVWRYMYVYRDTINQLEHDYINEMDDFFTNPTLDRIINNGEYKYLAKVVEYLKNPANAKEYLKNGIIDQDSVLKEKDKEILVKLVEKTKLFYE